MKNTVLSGIFEMHCEEDEDVFHALWLFRIASVCVCQASGIYISIKECMLYQLELLMYNLSRFTSSYHKKKRT